MNLVGGTTPARTTYSGDGVIIGSAGEEFKIELSGHPDILRTTVPAGKQWRIGITIGVEETEED